MSQTAATTVVNLTPHPVTVLTDDGTAVQIPVGGEPPRVVIERTDVGAITVEGQSVPLCESRVTSGLTSLPAPRAGTLLVVSRMVAEAAPDRRDLVFPDDLVRDDAGQILGCRRLGRLTVVEQ